MKSQKITYHHGKLACHGYLAYTQDIKRPLVFIVHDWTGRNTFAEQKAQLMAEWGYVGFAVDMYGEGKTGDTKEEKSALISPLMADRQIIRERLQCALTEAEKLPFVDTQKMAIIGFCFGGLCALEFARAGNTLRGAVSVHGLLHTDPKLSSQPIVAKILALHGYDDPMVTHQQVLDFADEMTACHADWQLQVYGNTLHAFTNPAANDKNFGTVYNPLADKRAFDAISLFLREIFE